jgi:hypothetical protein
MRFEISSSPVRAVIVTHCEIVGAGVRDEHLLAVDDPRAVALLDARVRVLPASDPASGSVSPNAGEPASAGDCRAVTRASAPRSRSSRIGERAERGVRGHGHRPDESTRVSSSTAIA